MEKSPPLSPYVIQTKVELQLSDTYPHALSDANKLFMDQIIMKKKRES